MNRSIVITRYATALLKYAREIGQGERVCLEAEALGNALRMVPDLRRMILAAPDAVSARDKQKLLQSALGNAMSQEMHRFLELLCDNGRIELVEEILRDYVDLYHRSAGIRKARLTTATEPSEQLIRRLKDLVRQKTGDDALIEVAVDPSIIGGFVFDIDDYLMDASVKYQLDKIREQYIERNRRII